MSIEYDWSWHHEEDARMFNDAVMSIFCLGAPGDVALRSSLVNLNESKLLVKDVV